MAAGDRFDALKVLFEKEEDELRAQRLHVLGAVSETTPPREYGELLQELVDEAIGEEDDDESEEESEEEEEEGEESEYGESGEGGEEPRRGGADMESDDGLGGDSG